jgi:hypothetical protein
VGPAAVESRWWAPEMLGPRSTQRGVKSGVGKRGAAGLARRYREVQAKRGSRAGRESTLRLSEAGRDRSYQPGNRQRSMQEAPNPGKATRRAPAPDPRDAWPFATDSLTIKNGRVKISERP